MDRKQKIVIVIIFLISVLIASNVQAGVCIDDVCRTSPISPIQLEYQTYFPVMSR